MLATRLVVFNRFDMKLVYLCFKRGSDYVVGSISEDCTLADECLLLVLRLIVLLVTLYIVSLLQLASFPIFSLVSIGYLKLFSLCSYCRSLTVFSIYYYSLLLLILVAVRCLQD